MSYKSTATAIRNRRTSFRHQAERAIGGAADPSVMSGSQGLGMFINDSQRTKKLQSYDEFKSWVFVCASYIAKRIASQPILAGVAADTMDSDHYRKPRSATKSQRRIKNRDLSHSVKSCVSMADVEVIPNTLP